MCFKFLICVILAGSMIQNQAGAGNPKRLLRLFGVNVECQLGDSEAEPSTPDSKSVSSQGPTISTHQFYSHSYTSNYMVNNAINFIIIITL